MKRIRIELIVSGYGEADDMKDEVKKKIKHEVEGTTFHGGYIEDADVIKCEVFIDQLNLLVNIIKFFAFKVWYSPFVTFDHSRQEFKIRNRLSFRKSVIHV